MGYKPKVHFEPGGDTLTVEDGGTLNVVAGGTINGVSNAITLASSAETEAGALTNKAVTPKGLSDTLAADTASSAETLAGASTSKFVTPKGVSDTLGKIQAYSFAGHNLAGACAAAGVKIGDTVLCVVGLSAADLGDVSSKFEAAVTVADQIQQSAASDLHSNTYLALVLRQN